MVEGLRGPLTLITAPAGFGKTTLVASCVAGCRVPVAWLSLDKDDNQIMRFLSYLAAALQEADRTIGSNAEKQFGASQQVQPDTILTSLINDLESADKEIILVLDDYQFIRSQVVHEAIIFLLEHCPVTLHLVIATRSDPALPLSRLRARGQIVELRAAELRFTESEAAKFLNEVMGLCLDIASITMLAERTEGWIAGLQMAALSMRDRKDVRGFIEGFSGTNRYILDYLLEEVLASQSAETRRFLLFTSILERLTASLCDALTENRGWNGEGDREFLHSAQSAQVMLEYLERANLFLVPLDEERVWFRYHHLFADLLRTELQKSIGTQEVAQLHLRAAGWYEQNSLILDAIHHASVAPNDEMVERLIEQHYMQMVNRGEMYWVRYWTGRLSKELVYRRPWLCLYQALSRSWFGALEEATLLLDEAEKRIRSDVTTPGAKSMLGYHDFVKSRVIAMQGDTRGAIELCLRARQNIPADNLALQNEVSITLGYEYFLSGDFGNAAKILNGTIQSGYIARAINNPVAAYALLARVQTYQGRLKEAQDLLLKAEQLIQFADGQFLGATGLVVIEKAALLCEWNQLGAALSHLKQGLDYLPWWGKTDDLCLAYATLARIQLALGNQSEAIGAIEKAVQLSRSCGIFSEARGAVEAAQVKIWLVQGKWSSIERWAEALVERCREHESYQYEDELAHIMQVRILVAQTRLDEAILLISSLEESARSAARLGRLIEILLLKALALQKVGEFGQAGTALTESLAMAEPEGYLRIFLDEGQPMRLLLAKWLVHAGASRLRDYATHLLAQFDAEPDVVDDGRDEISIGSRLDEPEFYSNRDLLGEALSPREVEVLQFIAQGMTNQAIARQLIVAAGTIKAHTSSIYRKLDVANRTEAVARARKLGILA